MAYTLHQLSEREVEVAIRWTEVQAKKLLAYVEEEPHSVDTEMEYTYEHTITVLVHLVKQCHYGNTWVNCVDQCRHHIRYVPNITVYLGHYTSDLFFSAQIESERELYTIREKFQMFKQPFMLCSCERLGRDHLLETAKGKCNNCYIYGFVRGEDCSICMMDDGKPWVQTSCNHQFHDLCWEKIQPNVNGTKKCPLCRTEQTYRTVKRL